MFLHRSSPVGSRMTECAGQPKINPCRGVAAAPSCGRRCVRVTAQQRAGVVPSALSTLSPRPSAAAKQQLPTHLADEVERHPRSATPHRPPAFTLLSPEDPLQATVDHIQTIVGRAEACGLTKDATEDRVVTTSLQPGTSARHYQHDTPSPATATASSSTFAAVYDGHGGGEVSQFATERFHLMVEQDAKLWAALAALQDETSHAAAADVALRWQRLFHKLDKDFLGAPLTKHCNAGSTMLASVCSGAWLTVANAGDSRAVLCRNGRAVRLSTDHSPEVPSERQRVEMRGGSVKQLRGSWRIGVPTREGRVIKYLAVSRALGDREFKDGGLVTVEPDVCLTRLQPGVDAFTVYASDGLWKVCHDQEVVDCVHNILKQQCAEDGTISRQEAADGAAKALVQFARMRKSHDDVSVIVEMYA